MHVRQPERIRGPTGPDRGHPRRSPRTSRARRAGRSPTLVGAVGTGTLLGATAPASPAGAVTGGEDATETYSFMTALYDDSGSHYCGGAHWLTRNGVLTAAHCVEMDDISVRVGSTDRFVGGTERRVAEVVEHPDHELSQHLLHDDLALLKLDAPVEIASDRAEPGAPVRGLGWGMVDEFGEEDKPTTLQQLDSKIVAADRCAEMDPEGDLCSEHPPRRPSSARPTPAARSSGARRTTGS